MMKRRNAGSIGRMSILFVLVLSAIGFAALLAVQIEAQSTPNVAVDETPSATPTITQSPTATITATTTPTPTSTLAPTAVPTVPHISAVYLPVIFKAGPSSLPAPRLVTTELPVDFEEARATAQAEGLDIAFNKIGFHVGIGGNREGLMDSISELDASGVPVFLKTANDAEPIYLTQEMMKVSGVPHILVYRDVFAGITESDYGRLPADVAQENWELNKNKFPPELEPTTVWLETINEPDNSRASWLAEFSLAQAKLAVADGYKYAAFSWSSGEPTLESWELPEMLEFLRFAGQHPDQVAIAVHEYSFQTDYIASGDIPYPWMVGRFQKIFAICDKHNIPRPTILITEWGWEYKDIPSTGSGDVAISEAMEDIKWASWLYAAYPQVKGAAVWYLGEGDQFGSIHDQVQQLIDPVHDFSLSSYYVIHPGQFPIDESMFVPDPPTSATD